MLLFGYKIMLLFGNKQIFWELFFNFFFKSQFLEIRAKNLFASTLQLSILMRGR